ncbi:hypothetical protein LTR62_003196 [Meristemomyces frigidus]|uniref:alpha-amylase n=1 Tax=Meristemomyces frigidus TaxID=1508187 RepID=A0AAN7TKE3_9PEZI|nr:hypothetical protein LTR62_003196 [Meristemomyces frigidus]
MSRPSARLLPFISLVTLLLLSLLSTIDAASLAEWRTRSIYQVLTDRFAYGGGSGAGPPPECAVLDGLYCGGTWKGIQSGLDYVQGMGFDAIWISPVVAQLPQRDGEAYTAYWQQDLYSLNPNFGTEQDLKDLIAEVHSRGMFLMLDIVVNHMGYAGIGWADLDYSVFNPFNDAKYYHEFTPIQNPLNQTEVEQGWLGDYMVSLVDVKTDDPEVRAMYGDWISSMVSNYSIDGLRIDTAINVEATFFPGFVESAGVFATGEVMIGDSTLACRWGSSVGSILNYPIYYPLTRAFSSPTGSINDLVETMNSVKQNCHDPASLGSFSENHDVPRFANYTNDLALAKNIITYTFLADGIPIVYQGQEQHMNGDISPYMNRAPLWETGYNTSAVLYQHIATLNRFRQHVVHTSTNYTTYLNEVIYQDMHSIGMRKGYDGEQAITVLNNNGVGAAYFELPIAGHGFEPGTLLREVLTCTTLTVNETGYLNVPMFAGTPKVFYPEQLMVNSSLCSSSGVDTSPPPPMLISTTLLTPPATIVPSNIPTPTISPARNPPPNTILPASFPVPPSLSTTTTISSPHYGHHTHRPLGTGTALTPSIPKVLTGMTAAAVAAMAA